MNIHEMSVPELSKAAHDLAGLAVEIADEHPEAARAIIDVGALITEELLARAFGGGAEAREHAAKLHRERSGH